MNKKQIIEEALEQGMINIAVNATLPGVKLPPQLLGSPGVVLNLSWRFGTYMELTDKEVIAHLSFTDKEYIISLPYHSIFFLRRKDGSYVIFEQDSPIPEILEDVPKKTRHPHLLN